jgi:hypothetical protein
VISVVEPPYATDLRPINIHWAVFGDSPVRIVRPEVTYPTWILPKYSNLLVDRCHVKPSRSR